MRVSRALAVLFGAMAFGSATAEQMKMAQELAYSPRRRNKNRTPKPTESRARRRAKRKQQRLSRRMNRV